MWVSLGLWLWNHWILDSSELLQSIALVIGLISATLRSLQGPQAIPAKSFGPVPTDATVTGFFGPRNLKKKRPVEISNTYKWLVVDLPLWKIWTSLGIIILNMWKNKAMFQTTNQIKYQKHPETSRNIWFGLKNSYIHSLIASNSRLGQIQAKSFGQMQAKSGVCPPLQGLYPSILTATNRVDV